MTQNAKKGLLLTGPSQEDSAWRGRSAPSLAQAPEELEVADILDAYWAEAKRHYLAADFPAYASPAWRDLDRDDPRKFAGLMHFAEMWRLYGLEIADEMTALLAPRKPMYLQPSLAELNERHDDMIRRNRRGAAA